MLSFSVSREHHYFDNEEPGVDQFNSIDSCLGLKELVKLKKKLNIIRIVLELCLLQVIQSDAINKTELRVNTSIVVCFRQLSPARRHKRILAPNNLSCPPDNLILVRGATLSV